MSLWNPWVTVRSTILVQEEDGAFDNLERTDIPFPYIYTPARAFWLRALMKNCSIPWRHPGDLLDTFFLAGGITANLIGAVGGLHIIAGEPDWFKSKIFGYGYSFPFPQVGYCIGDQFKQQVYVKFDVANLRRGIVSFRLPTVELLQNSSFKRIFVDHGTISNYRPVTSEDGTTKHILTLDIEQAVATNTSSVAGSLTITGNVAGEITTTTVDVLEILPNWDLVVSDPPEGQFPQAGNFYELDNTWCIEDPFLMSGIWYGTDNQSRAVATGKVSSGKSLYWTSHQSPYEEGQIIGIYTWQNIEDGSLELPNEGISMRDAGGFEWRWDAFDWTAAPSGYSDKRYKELIIEPVSATTNVASTTTTTTTPGPLVIAGSTSQFGSFYGATAGWEERTDATPENVGNMFELEGIEHIRIEISTGGFTFRHNWFAPCLRGQYLKVDNKYYEILDHIEANIIDVKIKSVDEFSRLLPTTITDYSILNHKAWQIVEDYSLAASGDVTDGVFTGTINALSYNSDSSVSSFVLEGITDNFATFTSFNNIFDPTQVSDTITENNFSQRYKKTHNHLAGEPKKQYDKYQNWNFVVNNVGVTNEEGNVTRISTEYSITSISFPAINPLPADAPYSVNVSVRGDLTSPNLQGSPGYIALDDTYATVGNAPKQTGFSFEMDVSFGAGGTVSFLQSVGNLCLNGEYQANPYYVDIPEDTMIGFCEGTYFGFTTQGTNFFSNLMFLITTLRRPRGIASLFQALRQDNWVTYFDQISQRITVRRGSRDFKEYPMKNEIAIGKPESTIDGTSGTTIPLDSGKERLRRLQMKLPNGSNDDTAIMFGIGIANNRYGCAIAGDGLVDLQMLRRQGVGEGGTSIQQYKWGDYFVSPIYLYKKSNFQNLEELHVDIGVDTDEGPIHIVNGSVTETKIQYITNKQTLSASKVGFFDIIELWDGEHILVYGQSIRPFDLNGTLNNTPLNSSEWKISSAVMIIGTWDDTYSWGCPLRKGWENEEKYQYPLMVLNGVEYLSTIYNPLNKTLTIFCKCQDSNGNFYVGCLIISLLSFLYSTHLCIDMEPDNNNAQLNFLWRPPRVTNNDWSQEVMGGAIIPEEITVIKDEFNRILGPEATSSQVLYDQEVNVISTHILPDGTYILFYDTEEGIRALTSSDDGRRWVGTNVILGRKGSAATMVDRYLFYVIPSGIEVKHTQWLDFYDLRELGNKIAAGENAGNLEERIQSKFDSATHFLIGSGQIPIQRISGYITIDSSKKIFYYDVNNLLSCIESQDTFIWKHADNF